MKFCILAAGKGSRNTSVEGLHKALLPIENKSAITSIIDKLKKNTEIVIALGYKSKQIKTFLDCVYQDRNITFINVDNYDRDGSGPGYSLLCCKNELQEPFIFTSVDTIVTNDFDFEDLECNWLGVSYIESNVAYKYCLIDSNKKLYYGDGNIAYIGMAGIYDYKSFWGSLENKTIIKNEYQVVHGFDGLNDIEIKYFDWYDIGNDQSYEDVKKVFNNNIVANKNNQVIFIEGKKVIKYFSDETKIKILSERTKILECVSPKTKIINKNMYSYDFVDGILLSDVTDKTIMQRFLEFCKKELFDKCDTSISNFKELCYQMYREKTLERISKISETDLDKIEYINGVKIEPINKLVEKIDWDSIVSIAKPSLFHGDLQPENIIYQGGDKFQLIDCRESFGGDIKYGDMYYDMSKLYHALLINGNNILNKYYDFKIDGNRASFNFQIKNNLMILKNVFKNFCDNHGYDWHNIELLGILHYINICTLYSNFHDGQYGKFLFLYGKLLLTEYFNDEANNE